MANTVRATKQFTKDKSGILNATSYKDKMPNPIHTPQCHIPCSLSWLYTQYNFVDPNRCG